MSKNDVLLEVKGLKKYYTVASGFRSSSRKSLRAVDGVSLTLHEGETFGLVGESGCGKSTLGRTILKLDTVTEGEIIYKGEHIENYSLRKMRPLRKEMQIVFQDPYAALSPRMTIFESVKAPLDVQGGMTEKEKAARVLETLNYVGVSEHQFYKYPHELSGGQRQRVVIARAMITNPNFIICDEPVSALDVSVRSQVLNLMKRVQKDTGVAYLFISHDLSVVKYLCNTIAVMYLGVIVESGSKKELFENPKHPYTQALLSAIPVPDIHNKKVTAILQGDVPNPVSPPSGCRFHTRCPFAMERCKEITPELIAINDMHRVACHMADCVL